MNEANNTLAQPGAKTTETDGAVAPEPQADSKPESPTCGFSDDGRYFLVKIDVRLGYLAILGFLQEAGDYLKFHIASQRQAMAKSAIIKPGQKNGLWNRLRGK